MRYLRYIFVSALLAMVACSPKSYIPEEEVYCPIKPGDPVCFSMDIGEASRTKAESYPVQQGYTPVGDNEFYVFNVGMYKEGFTSAIGSANYAPVFDESNTDGTLAVVVEDTQLLWEDNVNAYGFKATAGESAIAKTSGTGMDLYCDQSTQELWTSYDKLLGYAAVGNDDKNTLNHHKIQEWFAQNKADYAAAGLMADEQDLMKIPIYMEHQRALVTVILKAAEGVRREDLQFLTQEENIDMRIFQKSGSNEVVPVKAYAEKTEVEYQEDIINGPAGTYETTCYHAIVEPYNYIAVAETDPICTVNLSGQNFSFYASSDTRYNSYKEGKGLTAEQTAAFEKAYDLKPGTHVVITATLSRESRKILMTAYVEDWEEIVTSTICDDYGKNGDPIQVSTIEQLKKVLAADSEQNVSGNVILLTSDIVLPADWNGGELKCMLNLAGHTISTSKPLFQKIADSGSIVNGSVKVTSNVGYAIARENLGTLERVSVSAAKGIKASVAGMVQTNWRTIYNCASSLPVYGNPASANAGSPYYVGGIAAEMKQNGTVKPIIDGCTVDAKVDGNRYVAAGGGIVGNATGRVSNNNYEYGITLSQDSRFKNISGGHIDYVNEQTLTESNNTYPDSYSGIIDCQSELAMLFETSLNASDKTYRIADDFTVDQTWNKGICSHTLGSDISGNVLFSLDGNDKTITLTSTDASVSAPMLFTNVQNTISNLTICVEKPIFRQYQVTSTDEILSFDDFSSVAALAYAVSGGKLSRVKIYTVAGAYIQASNAAGIAVWALKNATIEDCEFHGEVRGQGVYGDVDAHTVETDINVRLKNGCLAYGGIVAAAEIATFNRCVFHDGCTVSIPTERKDKEKSYFGGILGACMDSVADDAKPLVVLTDCTSYLSGTTSQIGAVVGYSVYKDGTPVATLSGTDSGKCQGNWWRTTENYAVAVKMNLKSDVQTIGKRNSVTPMLDTSWFQND